MKNSFPLLSSLGDDHVTFEDVIGDDWTDPIAVLPLPRLSKTCVGDQQAAGGAAENDTKTWQGITKTKIKVLSASWQENFSPRFIGVFL